MANKNFEVKHGLSVGGTERITAAGAGSLTNLTLSGNLTVQGTTVTLDASTLQVADKNIVLNYHASNDTSSASSGAGITIQDAVNGTTDATILWDASDDEFDFSHAINIPNLKVSGAQGTDGQLLTSTGSGIGWEDAPASGPTHKTFGTSSIMIGDSTTGTINAADYNTGLGVDVFANLTSGDQNTVLGFEAGNALTTHSKNTLIGYQAGKLLGGSSGSNSAQRNVFIGYGAGLNVDEGQRAIAIGYYAMMSSLATTTNDIAIGYQAMQYRSSNTGDSIAIGENAHRGDINQGYQNANRNVAIGSNALSVIETGGMQNTAVGWWAGFNVTTGPFNTLIGSEAGQAVTTGQLNTLIGYRAGELISTGNYNVILGGYDGNEGGLDIRTSNSNIILSDGNGNIRMRINSSGNVGIGTTSPSHKLDVTGTIRAYASGSGNAWLYTQNDNKTYLTGVRGSSSNAYSIYDLTLDKSRFRVNSDGGIAIGENNVGYAGQILSIKAGAGDNVLYGESTDTKCIVSLRDNSSTANIGYGALANAHAFFQDGTEVARISTGSADKYPTSGNGGIGGAGTNLHLHGDDSEIRMANQIIHSDNSGLTKFTIRNAYGYHSTGAELSLDSGYISFNTGSSYTERMRIRGSGEVCFGQSTADYNSAGVYFLASGTYNGTIYSGLTTTQAGSTYHVRDTTNNVWKFYVTNAGVINATTTSISSLSDERLKENIVDLETGLTEVMALKPRRFDWKEGEGNRQKNVVGFIAQEIEPILPDLIGDFMHDDIDDAKSVKMGDMVPTLVKAIQEQQTIIQELEARIATLEG